MVTITQLKLTLLIDNSRNEQSVINAIDAIERDKLVYCTQIIFINQLPDTNIFFNSLSKRYPNIALNFITSPTDLKATLATLQTDIIAYLPCGVFPHTPLKQINANCLAPWVSPVTLPQETAKEISVEALGWSAPTHLVKKVLPLLGELNNWPVLAVANALERSGIFFNWTSVPATELDPLIKQRSVEGVKLAPLKKGGWGDLHINPITPNSTVLAIIPHYHCEAWLHRCLHSLVSQTRPLDSIVVVDDGSGYPPINIVQEFPNVTLLTSPCNVGPYRLVQQVIEQTNYDAYLFQDADDWSSCDRLEKLLYTAAEFGAQLIGTQEFRVYEEQSKLIPVCYPPDVNQALAEKPGHPLLHPSSLVTRNLVMKIGGFATGLKFGGDTEFLLRAAWVSRIINLPDYCYFRRKRPGSLTTNPDTGLDSSARLQLLKALKNRAYANYAAIQEGQLLDLQPLVKAEPIKLRYLTGPKLQWIE